MKYESLDLSYIKAPFGYVIVLLAICPVSDLYYAPQISCTQYQNTLSLNSILCIYISLYMYTFLYIYVYIFQNKEIS